MSTESDHNIISRSNFVIDDKEVGRVIKNTNDTSIGAHTNANSMKIFNSDGQEQGVNNDNYSNGETNGTDNLPLDTSSKLEGAVITNNNDERLNATNPNNNGYSSSSIRKRKLLSTLSSSSDRSNRNNSSSNSDSFSDSNSSCTSSSDNSDDSDDDGEHEELGSSSSSNFVESNFNKDKQQQRHRDQTIINGEQQQKQSKTIIREESTSENSKIAGTKSVGDNNAVIRKDNNNKSRGHRRTGNDRRYSVIDESEEKHGKNTSQVGSSSPLPISRQSATLKNQEHHSPNKVHQRLHGKQQHHHHQQQQQQQRTPERVHQQTSDPQPQRVYQHHSPQPQQQPEGWRVKLYRLNADGSWDDCGTGRIVCLYRSPKQSNKKSPPGTGTPNDAADMDQWLYQETGEAILCVHAEISTGQGTNNANNNEGSETNNNTTTRVGGDNTANRRIHQPQVLLRTRILLQDAYQRQGDNIITWCEPYYASNQNNNGSLKENNNVNANKTSGTEKSVTGSNAGVDLALSFQDNAGCLDIWRQITQVQGRAALLLRQQQQQLAQQQQHVNASTTSVEDMAAQTAAQHHASLQKEQQEKNALLWNRQQQNQQYNRHHQHQQQEMHYGTNVDQGNNNSTGVRGLAEHDENQELQYAGVDCQSDIGTTAGNDNNGGLIGQQQQQQWQLLGSPTLENLEKIGDIIASFQHVAQQRETLVTWMIADDCLYLKNLLKLFPAAEDKGDYSKLATLAACVKCILLLNDPSILEWIVNDSSIFEQVCSCLEYDPDLREKANHRWFLRERAKFRTVVPMEDPSLISMIHRSFRVSYLRDTLLRPTMDEASLSTLTSLQTFTHNEVVKVVATSACTNSTQHAGDTNNDNVDPSSEFIDMLKGSYMLRVIRMLGVEMYAINSIEWNDLHSSINPESAQNQENMKSVELLMTDDQRPRGNNDHTRSDFQPISEENAAKTIEIDPSIVIPNKEEPHNSTTWKQYLAPQDVSVVSRRMRRRGCLGFLRELFNMVRMSLQQCDKDDFFSAICTMEIDLVSHNANTNGGNANNDDYFREISDNVSQTSQIVEVGSVASTVRSFEYRFDINDKPASSEQENTKNSGVAEVNSSNAWTPSSTTFLSIMGNLLSDPQIDNFEKGLVLEIVRGIVMQDPALIRHHCVDVYHTWKRDTRIRSGEGSPIVSGRPEPNENKQAIYFCQPDDLIASLLYLLAVESDAGILLQVSEIMRIILDTDLLGDPVGVGPMSPTAGVFNDTNDEDVEGYPSERQVNNSANLQPHEQQLNQANQIRFNEQKQFLMVIYEHYIEWLVVPFQFTLLSPLCRIAKPILMNPSEFPMLQSQIKAFRKGEISVNLPFFKTVPPCAIRSSYSIEILSFCVRAHLYRMKVFLLKTRIIGSVLALLYPRKQRRHSHFNLGMPGDRCLKLAALRFLRAILSVKDEQYHRHIIQHNLFQPVFDTFRENPVGDNLVSSTIVEICDFIHNEKIKSVLEHIVTKHLMFSDPKGTIPSLEDVSGPYVSTLSALRRAYESTGSLVTDNDNNQIETYVRNEANNGNREGVESQYFTSHDQCSEESAVERNASTSTGLVVHPTRHLTGKALEDQRKFRETDDEESYFDSDEDGPGDSWNR